MSVFNVYLGNPRAMEYHWQELADHVDALIMPAIVQDRMHRYTDVRVRSVMQRPQLSTAEMLCYVLPNQFSSLAGISSSPGPGHAGQTVSKGNEVLCEVYTRGLSLEQVARSIVHEFLHAKTGLGNAGLHGRGGLCASPPAALDNGNIRLMADNFFLPLPQWLGGFQ